MTDGTEPELSFSDQAEEPKATLSIQEVIAELESGRHVRANGVMLDPHSGGRCCLGVMAKMADIRDEAISDRGSPVALPIQEYRQFMDAFPWLPTSGLMSGLMQANDSMRVGDPSYTGPLNVLRGVRS